MCPVLGGGKQAVVLLQPGESRPLVLPGVDSEGGGKKGAAAVLCHDGQPQPLPCHAGALPHPVPGGLLPPVCAGGVGERRGPGVRLLLPGPGAGAAPGCERTFLCLLRLRNGEPHLHGTLGAQKRGVVPAGGVLLQLPPGTQAKDRPGVCRRPGGPGQGPPPGGGGGGPLRRQLHRGTAAARAAGTEGPQRRALRHPAHRPAAEGGETGHLFPLPGRHPGVRSVPLGHQRQRR